MTLDQLIQELQSFKQLWVAGDWEVRTNGPKFKHVVAVERDHPEDGCENIVSLRSHFDKV